MPVGLPEIVTRVAAPAGLLVAVALADRAGAEAVAFYCCLAGLVVCAAGGLAALGRLVDGAAPPLGTLRAVLAAALAVVFFAGAAARSPGALAGAVSGLADLVLVAGLVLCGLLALVALPVRR
jgi:hypothetical protein